MSRSLKKGPFIDFKLAKTPCDGGIAIHHDFLLVGRGILKLCGHERNVWDAKSTN